MKNLYCSHCRKLTFHNVRTEQAVDQEKETQTKFRLFYECVLCGFLNETRIDYVSNEIPFHLYLDGRKE